MHSEEILALARQGNPKVLTAIINHAMRSYGVQAQVVRREPWLHILLEAGQAPEQQSSIAFIQSLLRNLGVDALNTVRVYGHRLGEKQVSWQQDVPIHATVPPQDFENPFVLPPDAALVDSPTAEDTTEQPETIPTAQEQVTRVIAEVMPQPLPESPSALREEHLPSPGELLLPTEHFTHRPEAVVFVFLLSLFTLWDLYSELMDEPADAPLTTGRLAQRLGVSRKVIRRQKYQPDFSVWTQNCDPEGVAWQWHQGRGFVPVGVGE